LPAVQAAREAARKVTCRNNLKQIALGTLVYAAAHGDRLPHCFVPRAEHKPDNNTTFPRYLLADAFGWRAFVLPQLEQQALHDALDFRGSPLAKRNAVAVLTGVRSYECPSTPGCPRVVRQLRDASGLPTHVPPMAAADYACSAVMHVTNDLLLPGAWWYARDVGPDAMDWAMGSVDFFVRPFRQGRLADVTDGLSQTVLQLELAGNPQSCGIGGECLGADSSGSGRGPWAIADSGWVLSAAGVNSSNDFLYSFHPGGAHVVMCDGSVHFLAESVPRDVLIRLFAASDGEILRDQDWRK
jgi:prepilin-type processing-associated H-X9-DG protein